MKKMYVVLALIITFCLGMVFSSFAYSTLQRIEAYIDRGIKITWDGELFTPRDSDGTVVYPIIYRNRTYLPVRFVTENAGLEAGWDEDSRTIILSSKEEEPIKPDENKNSKEVDVGEKFNIVLDENPTTGFAWHYEIVDETVLALDSDEYVPDEVPGNVVGSGGEHIWKFKALKKGSTKILFEYYRSWDKQNIADTREYNITVN